MEAARSFLREATQGAHERVDMSLSELDLTERLDYSALLMAHTWSLSCISDVWASTGIINVARLQQNLQSDLRCLERSDVGATLNFPPFAGHALGIGYVLSGSHFGSKLLLRNWSRSKDTRVLEAGRYLQSREYEHAWPKIMNAISALPQTDWDHVAKGANWTFSVFEIAGKAAVHSRRIQADVDAI